LPRKPRGKPPPPPHFYFTIESSYRRADSERGLFAQPVAISCTMDDCPVALSDADVAAAFAESASQRSSFPTISTSGRFAVHNTALSLQYPSPHSRPFPHDLHSLLPHLHCYRYADIYFCRLNKLKPAIAAAAAAKWPHVAIRCDAFFKF